MARNYNKYLHTKRNVKTTTGNDDIHNIEDEDDNDFDNNRKLKGK